MSHAVLPISVPPTIPEDRAGSPARLHPLPRRYRPDLEGLRTLAVVGVVLYDAHLGVPGGFVGVDVLFVLCGFLTTRQLAVALDDRRLAAVPRFYARRIKRLLPTLVLVLVATVLAARCLDVPAGLATVITRQSPGSGGPLAHLWPVGVQAPFFVLWPAIVVLPLLLPRRLRGAALTILLALLLVGAYRMAMTPQNQHLALTARGWELAVGGLVGAGAPWAARLPRLLADGLAFAGLAAVVASCFALSDLTPYPGPAAVVPVAGAALLLVAGVGGARRVERMLGEALAQCIGRVAFAWYLWHWPMLVLAPAVVGHRLDAAGRVVVIWLSLVAAVASYFLVEHPVRRRGPRAATGDAGAGRTGADRTEAGRTEAGRTEAGRPC